MADLPLDEAATRAMCAELFTTPGRLFNSLTHRVERRFLIEPHTHADLLQLDLLVGCTGQAWSQSKWLPIRGMTALVAYPHEPHGYDLLPGEPPSRVYHLKLRVGSDNPLVRRRVLPRCITGMPHDEPLIAVMRQVMAASAPQQQSPLQAARLAEVICLWPRAGRPSAARSPEATGAMPPWLADALQTIQDRPSDPPSLAELAASAGLSVRHFSRRFSARMGTTPHAYINQRRCALASELLLSNQLKVRQIAEAVGFSSVATFSRWFRDQTGTTPRDFRRDPTIM